MKYFLFLFFFFLISATPALADISAPTNNQVITNDTTSFNISGNAADGDWLIFSQSGDWVCADALPNGSYGNNSMSGWKTACGTSATLGNGAYHMLWVDAGQCRTNGAYATCKAGAYYNGTDICLDVGNGGYCDTGGSTTSTASTGVVVDFNRDFFYGVLVFFLSFFVAYNILKD